MSAVFVFFADVDPASANAKKQQTTNVSPTASAPTASLSAAALSHPQSELCATSAAPLAADGDVVSDCGPVGPKCVVTLMSNKILAQQQQLLQLDRDLYSATTTTPTTIIMH